MTSPFPKPSLYEYTDRLGFWLLGTSASERLVIPREAFLTWGGAGDDRIAGNNSPNMVIAGPGNDHVLLLGGNDQAWLEGGLDTVDGGAGDDMLWGEAGRNHITGGLGADYIQGGDGADTIFGGRGRTDAEDGGDYLSGGGGRDRIFGGAGDDMIGGGADEAIDILVGGRGADVFSARDNDRILDFRSGVDMLGLLIQSMDDVEIVADGDDTLVVTDTATVTLVGFTGTLTAADLGLV